MNKFTTPEAGFFKQVNILFGALLFGQLSIVVVLLFVKSTSEGAILLDNTTIGMFSMIVLSFGLIVFLISKVLYQKLVGQVKGDLPFKLQRFRSALVIRYALIEGVTILSVILFFISGEVICLVVAIASLIHFASLRPTRQRAINDLDLTGAEQRELHGF